MSGITIKHWPKFNFNAYILWHVSVKKLQNYTDVTGLLSCRKRSITLCLHALNRFCLCFFLLSLSTQHVHVSIIIFFVRLNFVWFHITSIYKVRHERTSSSPFASYHFSIYLCHANYYWPNSLHSCTQDSNITIYNMDFIAKLINQLTAFHYQSANFLNMPIMRPNFITIVIINYSLITISGDWMRFSTITASHWKRRVVWNKKVERKDIARERERETESNNSKRRKVINFFFIIIEAI